VSAAPRTAGLTFFATLPAEMSQAMSRKTDANGVVTLDGLPAGSSVRLEVTDPRFARLDYTDNVQIGAGPDHAVKPIRLRAGGSIAGTVIYGTTGKPASGVEIVAQSLSTGGGHGWGRAVTNERGEYRMEQVGEGVYNVMFGTNAGELQNKWTAVARRDVRVGAGQHVAQQDMTLIEGVVITGKVFRGDSGAAVEGMYVGLYGPEHPRSSAMIRGARTNADGQYTLRAPPGSNYVYLSAMPPDGYRQPKAQDVDIVDEGPLTIDFALPRKPGKPVIGRVLAPDGKPAAGAAVWAEEKTAEMYARPNTKTDAKGEFRFEALTPGTLLRASVAKMLETTQTTQVNGGEADVTLRLEKRVVVALSGVVTDSDGKPIAAARVQVITHEGQFGHGMGTPEVTDAEGRYRIAGLSSSGRYSVDARADGYGVASAKVTLTPGQDTAEAPALQLKAATSTITGIVVDGAGQGVAGIGVELNGSENGYQTTKTGPDGRFSFKAVPGTRALLFLRGSDGQPYGTTDARAGGKEVRLTKAK
jgi:protocatechuate 3,4-dioxygenase beta subunit